MEVLLWRPNDWEQSDQSVHWRGVSFRANVCRGSQRRSNPKWRKLALLKISRELTALQKPAPSQIIFRLSNVSTPLTRRRPVRTDSKTSTSWRELELNRFSTFAGCELALLLGPAVFAQDQQGGPSPRQRGGPNPEKRMKRMDINNDGRRDREMEGQRDRGTQKERGCSSVPLSLRPSVSPAVPERHCLIFSQSFRKLASPMSVSGCLSNCSSTLNGMVAMSAPSRADSITCSGWRMLAARIWVLNP